MMTPNAMLRAGLDMTGVMIVLIFASAQESQGPGCIVLVIVIMQRAAL